MKKIYLIIFTIITALYLSTISSVVYCQDTGDLIPPREGENVEKLPSGDFATHFLPRTIDIIFALQYTAVVGFLIYAGVLYIRNEEIEKAKNIFIYAIIGFLVATVSFAFVEGILSFKFFE